MIRSVVRTGADPLSNTFPVDRLEMVLGGPQSPFVSETLQVSQEPLRVAASRGQFRKQAGNCEMGGGATNQLCESENHCSLLELNESFKQRIILMECDKK